MSFKCPVCARTELEGVWVRANKDGNDNADWCPKCEASILYHTFYAHPFTGDWKREVVGYLDICHGV